MTKILKNLIEGYQPLNEMANIRDTETGVTGFVIWISTAVRTHGPRVKVYLKSRVGDKTLTVHYSIDKIEPRIVKQKNLYLKPKYEKAVKDWIILNYDLLMELWNSDSENVIIMDFIERIKKVNL